MQSKQIFTKTDTLFFKGIGISMIILHNYLHRIPGYGLENEAQFNTNNFIDFLNLFTTFSVVDFFGAIFGFLGHYGVQIFIVFSAYGLSIQYSKQKEKPWKFILSRLKKIYFLLFFAIAICLIINYFTGKGISLFEIGKRTFLLSTTLSGFSHDFIYSMFSGPFWFFALIIQLYILFPLLYKLTISFSKKNVWIVFALSFVVFYAIFFTFEDYKYTLIKWPVKFATLGNIFGHLPEVILGISMAHFKFTSFSKPSLLLALGVFIVSQIHVSFFPLSFLAISILLIQGISYLNQICSIKIKNIILYIGQISMILFIVNGPLRFFDFFTIENTSIRALRIFLFLPLLLILSQLLFIFYSFLIKKLNI